MSDETKQPWTPGEWEASTTDRVLTGPMAEDFADWIILVGRYPEDDEGMVVARAYNDAGQRTKANATLIAAAPALAKALAAFVITYDRHMSTGVRGTTVYVDPPEIAAARSELESIGWKWGKR